MAQHPSKETNLETTSRQIIGLFGWLVYDEKDNQLPQ